MRLNEIAAAAVLVLSAGAFAVTPRTPPGTPGDPHPDSPTSMLRKAKQGPDAAVNGNSGPVANSPVTPDSAAAATSQEGAKTSGKKRKQSGKKSPR